MFGAKPLNTTTPGFGQQKPTTTGFGGFGFGQAQQQQLQQQQPLIATVDKNPYGNDPLFDLNKASASTSKAGPTAVALEPERKKQTTMPSQPINPRVVSKIKLRGYAYNAPENASNHVDGISDDAVLGADAFAPRQQNKKLVFDDDVDVNSIAALLGGRKTKKNKPVFDTKLDFVAAEE